MKFISILSVFISLSAFASFSNDVNKMDICEDLYNKGDMRAYEDCVSSVQPLSIPRNLCKNFGYGTVAYEACMRGDYDKPASIPRNMCAEYFGFNTPAFDACMNGEYDSAKSVPHSICLKLLPHNPAGYKACMRGDFDEPLF